MRFAIPTLAFLLLAPSFAATDLAGQATIVDGGTLAIGGERIRLLDIDAPDGRQICTRLDGTEWRCGEAAASALADWIGQRKVTCAADSKDSDGRWLARCAVAGQDVASWLALNGWVLPGRTCKCEVIREAAGKAEAARIGIWSGGVAIP